MAQKLLIRENYNVLFVDAPPDYDSVLGGLPSGVTVLTRPAGPVDLIQVFVTSSQ